MLFPRSWHLSRAKFVLLVLLFGLILLGAAPHYLNQKWPWLMPPPIAQLKELRAIRQQGVPIQSWQTAAGQPLEMGEHHWYQQSLAQGDRTATVLLLPQGSPTQQPQVEWNDIQGIQRWQTDSLKTLRVTGQAPDPFETRFFRAWTPTHTYAVLQWYAQSNGGSPVASKWYVVDRLAQWRQQRVPWIAVSVQMPMAPLDDLAKYQDGAIALAQDIQVSLQQQIFHPTSAAPT
jgi:cyanoexosortase B-associated protein